MEQILNYDKISVKEYHCNAEQSDDGKYILSFENRHLKISSTAKKIIDKFNGERTFEEVSQSLIDDGINFSVDDLQQFVEKVMVPNGMIVGTESKAPVGTNAMLWARFPMIESSKLKPVLKITQYLFNKWIVISMIILIVAAGIFNVVNIYNAGNVLSNINSLYIILIGYLSLAFHEIGHISAAYHYNVNCGKMGIGVYLFYLVFFVDVSNTWKLESKKRMVVDMGGVYFQLITTIPLMILAIITGNIGYSIVALSMIIMTIPNFFPFLKLDGYWLLVDWLHLDNLSVNAFKVVRNAIFGKVNCTKKYLICSILYVVSLISMIVLGIYSAFKVIASRAWIIEQIKELGKLLSSGKYGDFFGLLNNLIVFVIPLLFLVIIFYNLFGAVIKGIVSGLFKNKHNSSSNNNI